MREDERRSAVFSEHRGYLFAVAYRLLGIAEDAEDVIQDAWIRFSSVRVEEIDSPRAFLVTIVARLSLDVLRSARKRREEYVGVWLPEPVPTHEALPADLVEQAESASFAFLLLLERLNPVERAAIVLHDVFDYSHKEIAAAIERTPDATRQALSRARRKLGTAPSPLPTVSEHARKLVAQFLEATQSGEVEKLVSTLAADVVLMSDGGGQVQAASRPLAGATQVARFFGAINKMAPAHTRAVGAELNGQLAMIVFEDGVLANAFLFDATPQGLTAIYVVRNPDKLRRLAR